jgi:hypothetical protein
MLFLMSVVLLLLGMPINVFPTLGHIKQLLGDELDTTLFAELVAHQDKLDKEKRSGTFNASSLLVDGKLRTFLRSWL